MDAHALLSWLKKGGYSLGVETRVEARHHDAGVHRITYADSLLIEDPEEPGKKLYRGLPQTQDDVRADLARLGGEGSGVAS